MATRSDQLQSHQFAVQRAVNALAMRDPDAPTGALRRIKGSLFAGVMLAALAVAATGVYGALRPGGESWRDGRATIVEQETGARFVYLDGTLHPVLNHSSAALILGTTRTVLVPRTELLGVPRGAAVGIPGAPDPLPGRDLLVREPWSLCSRSAAGTGAESTLHIGWAPPAQPLATEGLLAVDPIGGWHLLWNGRRFALREPEVVLAAFAWSRASAVTVPAEVLNAIPAGPELGPVQTVRSNESSIVPGLAVGTVFVVTNPDGDHLYGVALADGVSDVTAVQAAILVAAGANHGDPPRELSPASYAAAPKLASLVPTGDDAPPANTPAQVTPGESDGVCATFTDDSYLPTLRVTDTAPPAAGELPAAPAAGAIAPRVDRIAVPPGHAVVVESLPGPQAPHGSLALVSDLGRRFAVPSTQVLGMLGYADVQPVRLPGALVALIPAGPALDPAAAMLPSI